MLFQNALKYQVHDIPWMLYIAGKEILEHKMDYKDRSDGRLLKRLFIEKQRDFYRARPKDIEKERRKLKMEHHIRMLGEDDFNNAPTTHPEKPDLVSVSKRARSAADAEDGFEGDSRSSSPANSAKRARFHIAAPVCHTLNLHSDVQDIKLSTIAGDFNYAENDGLRNLTFQEFCTMFKFAHSVLLKMSQTSAKELLAIKAYIENANKAAEDQCEYSRVQDVGAGCRST